jgi:hypothetical protein
VYYAELRTFDVYAVTRGDLPRLLFHAHFKPDSLAVDQQGTVFVAARSQKHKLVISRYVRLDDQYVESLVWAGPQDHFPAHIALKRDGELVVGWHTQMFRLNGIANSSATPMSSGYTDPVFTFGKGDRIWVADNALPGHTEHVGTTPLPAYTNPTGMTLINDELLVCSGTHKKVYRLHVDKRDVPHWRNQVGQLVCDRDIGSMSDGSIITAQTSVIYRYPPRR